MNRKRKASEFERAYGGVERVEFVKSLPCLIRQTTPGELACVGPTENAHTKNGGAGRKADARFIVPLCRGHHTDSRRSLHAMGFTAFEIFWAVDLTRAAARIEKAWRATQERNHR